MQGHHSAISTSTCIYYKLHLDECEVAAEYPAATKVSEDILYYCTGSLVLDIFRGPIQIVIGLLYGILSGLLLWVIPTKSFVSCIIECDLMLDYT